MVQKMFKKISIRLMDLFAELNDLKEHCKRCLEQDLANENIKKTEYQANYDTFSRQEAERLSKLNTQKEENEIRKGGKRRKREEEKERKKEKGNRMEKRMKREKGRTTERGRQ
jgi:hypothetical protein